ncbi:MAG: hypothetical protein ACNA8W_04645, partial [Bradymonadaceae bacterium]
AANRRFEGEADAFPIGRGEELRWMFTYGFRTDPQIGDWLAEDVLGAPVLPVRLTDPRYYHGDTLLCDLGGPCMAWLGGVDSTSAKRLRDTFGAKMLELDDADADAFVGNSFYVETPDERLLFASKDIPTMTRTRIEDLGVRVVPVDISEFFGKGGGGPKCMVFNLGDVDAAEDGLSNEARRFRASRHIQALRGQG